MKDNEKTDDDMKEMKRRLKFLEMASIVNTLVEKKYYPQVVEALKQDSNNKFEAVCKAAEIPKDVRNDLWVLLKKAWTAETPWMSGSTPR